MVSTRRWLWQILIWVVILDGFIAFMLFVVYQPCQPHYLDYRLKSSCSDGLPVEVGALMQFFSMVIMTGTFGAITLTQDEVIQEKQSGTAAWILSKPAARPAFILTKLLASLIGVLVLVLPGAVPVEQVYLATHQCCPWCPSWLGRG